MNLNISQNSQHIFSYSVKISRHIRPYVNEENTQQQREAIVLQNEHNGEEF